MSLTVLSVEVASPADPARVIPLAFLVDSGAVYSVVPASVLEDLGIAPIAEEEFRLANGDVIRRRKGGALFRYAGKVGVADVIFGGPGDGQLLGTLTLESMGFILDPLRRELKPLPMVLGGWQAA